MVSDKHQPIPEEMIDAVGEELPTFDEIERFASDGIPPRCCRHHPTDCTSKILFALTRKKYTTSEANRLWRAINDHNAWLAERLGRSTGVSVAALDYLMNVSEEWDQAVVTESDQIENLTDAATLDGLTGLFVRDVFNPLLEKAVAESRRYGQPLSLLMADIDDFKAVNDNHGHQTGDAVLAAIGSDFSASLRSADIAARYGGPVTALSCRQNGIDTGPLTNSRFDGECAAEYLAALAHGGQSISTQGIFAGQYFFHIEAAAVIFDKQGN